MGWFWADSEDTPRVPASASERVSQAPSSCPVKRDGSSQGSSWSWFGKSRPEESKVPAADAVGGSGCPVKRKDDSSGWGSIFGGSKQNDAAQPVQQQQENKQSGCPVIRKEKKSWLGFGSKQEDEPKAEPEKLNPLTNMPELSAQKAPGQKIDLPTQRTKSSIPRGKAETEGVWEYPSPQQMLNAMLRKGGEVPEDAVESMVDVHNFLNEGAWQEILKWENKYTEQSHVEPRLLRFTGRPDEMTPKAMWVQLMAKIFPETYGVAPPFDRHDWTVLRGKSDGEWEEVRYVIDYYSGPEEADGTPSFYLDVRPALDSPTSVWDRIYTASKPTWDQAMGRGPGPQGSQ